MARFVVLLVLSVCSCVPFVAVSPRASSQRNAGVAIDQLICKLDPKVNATSFSNFSTEIQQLWEPFCGANRGIFVVEPADGQTYNCGKLPASWGIKTVADIVNLTPAKGTEVLSSYLGAVFNSSIVKTADTCDFQSLGRLHCGEEREKPWQRAPWAAKVGNKPLRGVNMGGLFVLEPWITPDFTSWDDDVRDQYTFSQTAGATATLKAHWSSWYTQADFDAMASHGLNVVRIPIGWWYFAEDAGLSSAPYIIPAERTSDSAHPITSVIKMAQKAGLSVIIDLHGAPSSQNGLDNSGQRSMDPQIEDWGDSWLYNATAKDDTTEVLVAIVKYVSGLKASGVDNVIALELLNEPWVFGDMSRVRDFYEDAITALRKVDAELPLIIHDAFRHEEWAWLLHDWGFENVFMDTHVYHAFNIADYASSTAACDKSKIVAHENMACRYSSMLRFKTCVSLPVLVGEFSLATDNCMKFLQGSTKKANQFENFGQCDNLKVRLGGANDTFWREHLRSFAMRQLATFEDELGWTFWTWKVSEAAQSDPSSVYWSFSQAVKEGLIDTKYPMNGCEHSVPQLDGC